MECVGKALSGLVTVYDVTFRGISFSAHSVFHGTARVLTPGCHGAQCFPHFLYEFLLLVISTLAVYKPGFIVVQYTAWSSTLREERKLRVNLTCG